MSDLQVEVVEGNGWKAGNLDGMGEGQGFRKVRGELGVTEMGVNGIVLPAGVGTGAHWHDRQEEVYFVHAGTLRFTMGEQDDESVTLGPGGVIRIAAATQRSVANVGDDEATYIVFGAEGGYVGRDGNHREGQPRVVQVET
ncbi:MAG: cupin domain-containing protein [Solirubrobacterales bacterium]|nr:cupin domain-containing protein [Solirubrobacterales bacterium]